MDKGYVERVKTELEASQQVYEQTQRDLFKARKELQKAEEALALARSKVDACKTMLIHALEP